MKKFKYRLQAVLKLKEHIEKEKQKEHALALQELRNQENKLESMDVKKGEVLVKQSTVMTGILNVAEILVYGRFLMKLKTDKKIEIEMKRVLNKTETDKRKILLGATKEKKIHEKLKGNLQEKFNKDFSDQENKDNDETAVNIYRRNQK